jgi:hypothetical protein
VSALPKGEGAVKSPATSRCSELAIKRVGDCMKDELSELDERKIADIIMKARPDLAWRVCQDPETEICKVFIGNKLILLMNTVDELDDPANIPRFLYELDQQLRLLGSGHATGDVKPI